MSMEIECMKLESPVCYISSYCPTLFLVEPQFIVKNFILKNHPKMIGISMSNFHSDFVNICLTVGVFFAILSGRDSFCEYFSEI